MRAIVAATFIIIYSGAANATMPLLTDKPVSRSEETCLQWAKSQDEDAIYAWGQEESGGSSKTVAIERLARFCQGGNAPEIVAFGSSAGFDASFCAHHRKARICRH